MITNDKIAQTIVKSLEDFINFPVVDSPETITMERLYNLCLEDHGTDDPLFDWIVIEAKEGGETEDNKLDIGQVIHVLERGRDKLGAVIQALWQLDVQDPDRQGCFLCGTRFDKGKGHPVEVKGAEAIVAQGPVGLLCDECKAGRDELEKEQQK